MDVSIIPYHLPCLCMVSETGGLLLLGDGSITELVEP